MEAKRLGERANHFRRVAREITDEQTARTLNDMAEELEEQAEQIKQQCRNE
jgi:23S rRNA maturation mini-RNase III